MQKRGSGTPRNGESREAVNAIFQEENERIFMLPKYTVEYSVQLREHAPANHYSTDDPVACEQFLAEALDRGARIRAVKHEGVDLPKNEFDRMVKAAATLLVARKICDSLHIRPEEERFRFGFAA
jgi:hypothetical protein